MLRLRRKDRETDTYRGAYDKQVERSARARESERVELIKREARRDAINDSKTRAEKASDIARGIKTAAYGVEKKKATLYGRVTPTVRVRSDALSRLKRLGR